MDPGGAVDEHARGRAKRLPPAARAGLMRAWIAILSRRHPDVAWIPADALPTNGEAGDDGVEATSK